jgi:hypothetical protein
MKEVRLDNMEVYKAKYGIYPPQEITMNLVK